MDILKKIGRALAFPFKKTRAWIITTIVLLVFFLVVSLVITQVTLINNTFNTVFGEERRVLKSGDPSTAQYYAPSEGIDSKADALAAANALNEELCGEGFTLLKNDGALPLAQNAKISVFGMNSVDLVYGGSGSAEKNDANGVDLYKSLENAGISYNASLKSFYDGKKKSGKGRGKSPAMGDTPVGFATGELPISEYSGGISSYIGEYNDAALVVISRIGGEGYDLPRTMIDENGNAVAGADKSSHYLELDNNEKALIAALCADGSGVDNVIIIINCATSMELGFVTDGTYGDKLKGALWVGTTGGTGMNALGKILKGEINPSGRLVDTYARDFTATPSWQNFSINLTEADAFNKDTYKNGNAYTVGGTLQDAHFVDYEEGIYVGYRYYETRGLTDGEEWYRENVVFPFGYGLSYSEYTWTLKSAKIGERDLVSGGVTVTNANRHDVITAEIEVVNNGSYDGKDVVQLYYSAPYYVGGIEKPHVVLGGFAKTPTVSKNGGKQTVTVEMPLREAASYDYADKNGNGKATYELEHGVYKLYIGGNAHKAWNGGIELSFTVDGDILYDTNDDVDGTGSVENRFDEVSNHIETYMSRSDFAGTFPAKPIEDDMSVEQSLIDSLSMEAYIGSGTSVDVDKKWYTPRSPRQKRKQQSFEDTEVKLWALIGKDYEDPLWDKLLNQLTLNEMAYLIGTGNFNTAAMQNIDKPKTIDPDGPAGFTQFMTLIESTAVVYDTCFYCSECVIGATWNVELAQKMGVVVGDESLMGNERGDGRTYSGWYAPAVNIHRNQFAGRNWEYYSEDGLLSGKMAAGVVKGAMSRGVYTYLKHFAVNDQETNRDTNGLITWLNEQALREIYLKPFELAVKEGGSTAVMSSFNRIGTVWAGGSYELLTEILRDEWGFKGMVITDYNTNGYMYADQMIRAGGDLNLMQDKQPSVSGIAVNASHRSAMRRATKNILYTVVNSNAMNGMGEGIIYYYAMPYWKIVLILVDVAVVVACAIWGVFAIRRALKKEKAEKSE